MRNFINELLRCFRKKCLVEKDFTIISDNCWGGFAYKYFGLKYTSPFVGLVIFPSDYIMLLKEI
jgi:uncharacterized protein (DUF1919 family)